jgi:hypothetical protein
VDSLFGEDGEGTFNTLDNVNGNDTLDSGSQVHGDTAITDPTEKTMVGFP